MSKLTYAQFLYFISPGITYTSFPAGNSISSLLTAFSPGSIEQNRYKPWIKVSRNGLESAPGRSGELEIGYPWSYASLLLRRIAPGGFVRTVTRVRYSLVYTKIPFTDIDCRLAVST